MATKDTPTLPPATNDAYTGMLGISLCALVVGCVLLYLDYSQYPDSKAPPVPKAPAIAVPAPSAPQQKAPEAEAQPKEAQPKQGEAPGKAKEAAEKE
jgi:hypothetical protein